MCLLDGRQEADIRKAAKEGNKEVCAVLAKQLVQMRKQKTRSYVASSRVGVAQSCDSGLGFTCVVL